MFFISFNIMRPIIRDRILKKYNYKCNYCNSTIKLEIDHIIPLSKGGKGDEINLQVLCRKCNREKSNKLDIDLFISVDQENECLQINRDFIDVIGYLKPNELQSIIDQKFNEIL